MDGSGETVAGLVGDLDGLLLVGELLHGADGTEDLLLDDVHVFVDIAEDGGLDVVSLRAVTLTTDLNLGTSSLAVLDVTHDAIELGLGDLGSLEGLAVEWVTDLVLEGTGLEPLEELVVDIRLDEDTATSTAALAVVEVDTEVNPGDGVFDISVVEDDVGALATQFESDLLQVALSSGREDLATDEGRSGEGNLVDVHVGRDGGTSGTTEAGDNVDDTRGETGLLDELGGIESAERGELRGLHDDSVSSSDGRGDLPGEHEEGEVPGDDLAADTDGLVAGVVHHIGVGIDDLAVDLVCPATVVAHATGGGGDITLCHADGLAVVEGFDGREGFAVFLEELSEFDEHATPVGRGDLLPGAFDSGAGSLYGDVDVLFGGLVDGGDGLLVVRVDRFKGLSLSTFDELIVDEAARC